MLISKTVITPQWIEKLWFYKIVEKQKPNWETVEVLEDIGERTKQEVQAQKTQVETYLAEIDEKLTHFPA